MSSFLKNLFGAQTPSSPAAPTAPDRPHPVHVSDGDFAAVVLESDKLAIVDLWADWCGPCHMLAPTIERLAAEYDGRAVVAKLDVDENPETANSFNILGIPTVLFFKKGQEIDRLVGVQPYAAFAARIERYLA